MQPSAMSDDLYPNPDVVQRTVEHELCIQCMTDNRPGSHFCRQCGSPLSSYAATGPFERLFAEGHLYRRATEQPQRLIVVLGVWVIFGAMSLAGIAIITENRNTGNHLGILAGIGLLLVSASLVAKTTKNYRNRQLTKSETNC